MAATGLAHRAARPPRGCADQLTGAQWPGGLFLSGTRAEAVVPGSGKLQLGSGDEHIREE